MAGGDLKMLVFCDSERTVAVVVYWSRIVSLFLPQNVDFCLPPAQACVCLWCHDFRHC